MYICSMHNMRAYRRVYRSVPIFYARHTSPAWHHTHKEKSKHYGYNMVSQLRRLQFCRHDVFSITKTGVVILHKCWCISVHHGPKTVTDSTEASLYTHSGSTFLYVYIFMFYKIEVLYVPNLCANGYFFSKALLS